MWEALEQESWHKHVNLLKLFCFHRRYTFPFHKLLKLSITLKISKLVRFLVHILPVEKLFKSPNSKMVTHFFVISNLRFFLPSLYL